MLFCQLKPLFHHFFIWLFFYSTRLSVGFLSSKRASLKLQADWPPPLCSWGTLCLSPLILLCYVKISVHESSLLDHKFLVGRDYILHIFVCLAPNPVPGKQEVCIEYVSWTGLQKIACEACTVTPRYSSASGLIKPCTRRILMRKKCWSTLHLLGTHHTYQNLYESQCRPAREDPSSLGTPHEC